MVMAGPIEILIVLGAFGIIGTYLYIVHRFIASGEESSAKRETRNTTPERNPRASRLSTAAL